MTTANELVSAYLKHTLSKVNNFTEDIYSFLQSHSIEGTDPEPLPKKTLLVFSRKFEDYQLRNNDFLLEDTGNPAPSVFDEHQANLIKHRILITHALDFYDYSFDRIQNDENIKSVHKSLRSMYQTLSDLNDELDFMEIEYNLHCDLHQQKDK